MGSNSSYVQSGYDLPLYGIDNGTFYSIHIPAIVCIVTSFVCVVIALVLSFRARDGSRFFTSWSKSDRFIVYLAICDGMFNISHFTDHMYIVILREMVRPYELCACFAFLLSEFVTAQNLMVNCVAVNAFMLIFFDKNLDLGKWDWKLLLWTFGAPFVGNLISATAGKLGPNGVFCAFDSVKGNVAGIFFSTVPTVMILVINSTLYILIWKRVRDQSRLALSSLKRASHGAARSMSLFVAAFCIQWWAYAVFGIWEITGDVPQVLFHLLVTFSNIGGFLNLIVYLIMKKGISKSRKVSDQKTMQTISTQPHRTRSTVLRMPKLN